MYQVQRDSNNATVLDVQGRIVFQAPLHMQIIWAETERGDLAVDTVGAMDDGALLRAIALRISLRPDPPPQFKAS